MATGRARLTGHERCRPSPATKGARPMSHPASKKLVSLGDLVAATFDSVLAVTPDRRQAAELTSKLITRRFAASARAELVTVMRELARLGAEEAAAPGAYAQAA